MKLDEAVSRLQAAINDLPFDDQVRAIDEIGRMTDGPPQAQALVSLILDGTVIVAGFNADGELLFRLSEAGYEEALHKLHASPTLRALVEQLTGRAFGDPPKRPQ